MQLFMSDMLERNVKETDIVIHGHSIGGAVGGLALSELRVGSAMIADRTFGNLLDIVAKICGTSGMLDTSIIGAIAIGYSFTALGLGYRLGISDRPIPYLSPLAWMLTAIAGHRVLSTLAPNEFWPLSPEIVPTFRYPNLVVNMLRYSICGLVGCFPFAMAATVNALSFRSMHGLIELFFSGISIGFLLGFHGYFKSFGCKAVKILGWVRYSNIKQQEDRNLFVDLCLTL
uniref:Uncharacterized protein n=1 Tax=Aplanochytrium stocchinoi TaxID=215587 RepID=A0A7S3LRY1_9STRA|mmetsp:Transcript_19081/g.23210  ORF Transcript_19081/g.23210 Transcript_19081/m.23210 type:complete len:230 (-) Transcript_19081:49-738(-)